jgi:hypothetical protein
VAEPAYKRLTWPRTRRGKSFLTALRAPRQSLWIGEDHLLSVDSASYSEEYKRFYFRDIQAVFICPTGRRAVWNGILAALLIMHLLVFGWFGAPAVILAIVAVVLAIPLIINNLFGPACRVYLRTAVQVEELPSLSRLPRARRVLDRIRPLITAVQGPLSPEAAARRLKEEETPLPAPSEELQ